MGHRVHPAPAVTPGEGLPCLVLLHSPLGSAADWGSLPRALAGLGAEVLVAEVADDDRPPFAARYVARAALEIAAAAPAGPILPVAAGAAGPLLPAIGAAQRAAHRAVAGYVLVDALLPQPGTPTRAELAAAQHHLDPPVRPPEFFTEPLPPGADWPDAPCGYLRTGDGYAHAARLAGMRSWPVREAGGRPLAEELVGLIAEL
ncbi:hypothetical protein [Actinorugispora endophytica]|uniref:Alpha/beta hydrolase family protein n=1 Tax=Actinorugispora endophytica TaxID=1605990 RepID=A0A4R6V2N7_9ACTN|nr:hypothetical protein [Actinorugispora endophytica]TDQ52940.1 hypothetical protein EV190_10557 [Actinorugispora endophytica]